MALNPTREAEVKEQIEREFAAMEEASRVRGAGVFDVLQVYGGLEVAIRQADTYLSLLNPIATTFSTTASSNIQR